MASLNPASKKIAAHSPSDAAHRLVKLIEGEIAASGYAHAYTGTVNSAFTRSGGTVP
jgi:hypothetical protein